MKKRALTVADKMRQAEATESESEAAEVMTTSDDEPRCETRDARDDAPGKGRVPLALERRGLGRQRFARTLERHVAQAIWRVVRGARECFGMTVRAIARALGVPRSTLYAWRPELKGETKPITPLGRRQRRASVAERNAVIATLWEKGPGVSLRFLSENHPQLARRELENLLRRFRRVYRRRQARDRCLLHWHAPQTVWAMDHAFPPTSIDGEYEAILVVRDLGSGATLLWTPVRTTGSKEVMAWLEALVAEYGAPLVLKADNGPAFTSFAMTAFFERHGIEPLYSPVRRPSYNGSCEASVGAMKTRTHEVAFEAGRPGRWRSEDLEAALARSRINNPVLPGRPNDRSFERREEFRRRVAQLRRELAAEYGHDVAGTVDVLEQRLVQRQSVRRALVERGLLSIRRRRKTLLN